MSNVIVTMDVLGIYEKYHGDFSLLYERWADEEDLDKLSSEQMFVFSQFIDKLNWLKVENISSELRSSFEKEILELEVVIDPEVARIVRERIMNTNDRLY